MNSRLHGNLVNRDQVRDYYLQGRRVRQASPSQLPDDYIIQAELTAARVALQAGLDSLTSVPNPVSLISTQASLPNANNYPAGTLIWISDYAHFLINTSGAWIRVLANRYLGFFLVAPGVGWHLADGTTGVSYLKSDGTLGTINMPAQPFYPLAGNSYSGPTPTAAVLPGVDNPANTGSGAANIQNNATATTVTQTTLNVNVAATTHTHTDSGHTHTIADPTVTLPGDPIINMQFLAYVRL